MNATEFYKMSVKEYPNHKDLNSLKFSLKELEKEVESESRFIDRYEDTIYCKNIMKGLLDNLKELNEVVEIGKKYLKAI